MPYIQGDGRGVVLMEYIEGETLDKVWPRYDSTQRRAVLEQLQQYLAELRGIKSDFISNVDGGPCCDQFFTNEDLRRGPYTTEKAFHEGLVDALQERGKTAWFHMVSRFVKSLDGHETVLTHNDMAPRNIIVRDGKVAAIIDWELCGYYPDYWEYVKAYLWADWESFWITENIPDHIMEPKIQELAYLLHARDILW